MGTINHVCIKLIILQKSYLHLAQTCINFSFISYKKKSDKRICYYSRRRNNRVFYIQDNNSIHNGLRKF